MFWGLILEPGKRYAQKVENSFHVSMAAIDLDSVDNEVVSVMVEAEKQDFILCNLNKKIPQQQMNHVFPAGKTIAFYTSGSGTVHLTGYLKSESEGKEDLEEEELEEMSEEETDEDVMEVISDGREDDSEEEQVLETSEEEEEEDFLGQRRVQQTLHQKSPKSGLIGKGKTKSTLMQQEKSQSPATPKHNVLSPLVGKKLNSEREVGESNPEKTSPEKKMAQETPKNVKVLQTAVMTEVGKKGQEKVTTPVTNGATDEGATESSKRRKKKKKKKKKEEAGDTDTNFSSLENKQKVEADEKSPKAQMISKSPKPPKTPTVPMKRTLPGGLMLEDVKIGGGAEAKTGHFVTVYYVGRLKQNKKQFDSVIQDPGFKFRLGQGEVIKGWDIGIQGMKIGGKRKITCPAHLGYGKKGSPPFIPPNSTLMFEVDLKAVK